ncbi:hypothetical protein [Lysobacter sp. CA196]|uniref:hypothetical protein n=1 Tax=Lysobacter sp. CA196 TaxID=3455606 RepID=UPI003F8D4EF8
MGNRKNRRPREAETPSKKRESSLPRANDQEEPNSSPWLDRWSSRASNLSQVLMLLLVAFGYFYTVRPVYQKDLLEEDLAKLTLESDRIAKQNKAAEVRSTRLQTEISSLQSERQQLLNQRALALRANEALAAQSTELKNRAGALGRELGRTTELNSRQLAQIKSHQETILRSNVGLFMLPGVIEQEGEYDSLPFIPERDLDRWAARGVKQPYQFLLELFDQEVSSNRLFALPEPRAISREVVAELRSRIQAASARLSCPTINKTLWLQEFRRQTQQAEETVGACLDFHIQHHVKSKSWSAEQVRHASTGAEWASWREGTKRVCRISARYNVTSRFNDAWQLYMDPCRHRVIYGVSVADGEKSDLEPIGSTNPPSFETTWFSGWYRSTQ